MSKIGEMPIPMPADVKIEILEGSFVVTGKEGEVRLDYPKSLKVEAKEGVITVMPVKVNKSTRALHGLFRSLIANAVEGVQKPWEKKLEIAGTGFNVKMEGENLVLKVGYSHPVVFEKRDGIKYQIEGNNKITVLGVDKQLVGQTAHQIKLIRRPDVYKGKGIKYEGEVLRIKPGKKTKTGEA